MKATINHRIVELISKLGISQNAFSKALETSSSRISNITTNRNKPDSEILEKIATVYRNVNIQWLLTGEGSVFLKADRGNPKGNPKGNLVSKDDGESYTKKVTLEPFIVDTHGMKLVPITDIHAAAGEGYINSETIDENDVLRLPAHMIKSGNHLCIRIKGVSMAPTLQDGGYVIIRHLDRGEWMHMPNERIYVVVDNEGKTYLKRVKNRFSGDNGFIVLTSDSPDKMSHPTFNLHPEEIAHIWYVEWYFTAKMPNIHDQYYSRVSNLEDKVDLIQEEFLKMKKQLK